MGKNINKYKKVFVLLLFTFLSTHLRAQYQNHVIISDLDDTYKITNTKCKIITVFNGLFTKKTFVGMPSLYQEMMSSAHQFYILSSSPEFIRKPIKKLMRKTNLYPDSIILKPNGIRGPKYKYITIKKIFETNNDKSFILIGDDSGHDHDIYSKLANEFPEQITAIYIRPVKYKNIDSMICTYNTAFDIACAEYNANRIDKKIVEKIAEEIINCDDIELILPRYLGIKPNSSICAKQTNDTTLIKLRTTIMEKIED